MKVLRRLKGFSKKLRKNVNLFLSSEEASLAKHSLAALGAAVLGAGAFGSVYAALSHTNNLGPGSDRTNYVSLQHQHHSTHSTHMSHGTHSTHGSHTNCCVNEKPTAITEAKNEVLYGLFYGDRVFCKGVVITPNNLACYVYTGDSTRFYAEEVLQLDDWFCTSYVSDNGWAGYQTQCLTPLGKEWDVCRVLPTGEVEVNISNLYNGWVVSMMGGYWTNSSGCCDESPDTCETCGGEWRC